LEVEVGHVVDVFNVLDAFDAKLIIFWNNMWTKVVKVIKPFLQFLQTYDAQQVHNMFTLILDPRFKSLKVVENYVGCGAYIRLVVEYDVNVVILLLMIMFEVLNATVQACALKVIGFVVRFGDFIEKDNNIFGVGASMEESPHTFVVGELYPCSKGYW